MDERNSTPDKNEFDEEFEVPQRIFKNLPKPQSTYTCFASDDSNNLRTNMTKRCTLRNIKYGNDQMRRQFGTDGDFRRPQLGSSCHFQGVHCDSNCKREIQFPLINSASHCVMPYVHTLPYLATSAYLRNQEVLFENGTHVQKEIKPEIIQQNVDLPAYKLPPFLPVFSGMLNRRRRREQRPRRQRTTFSTEQTIKLEMEYGRAEYISRSRRYELAESLNLTENQIKIWFQNRRAKEKRIEKAQIDQNFRHISFNQYFTQESQVPNYTEICQQCNLSTVKIRQDKSSKIKLN